jgi:hypothetical protein
MSGEQSFTLLPHPATPMRAVRAIEVDVARPAPSALRLRYRLDGETARLRIPPRADGVMTSGLWEHTCFEAFAAIEGEPEYREVNLSPSGDWAIHAFHDYRDGAMLADEALMPIVTVARSAQRLVLMADVSLTRWPVPYHAAALRLGLAAVVEGDDGGRSYWALAHPAERPDFHCADARRVRVAPLATTATR